MSTLHVDLGPHWRGGQNQALLLLQGLRARGHRAELIALRASPLATRAQADGIPVHSVSPRLARLDATLRVRQLLARGEFGLLHAHEAHALTAAWLAGAHRRACLVASRRVGYPLHSNDFALARYRAARRVLAVSRFVAESAIASSLPRDRVEIVYDGIELPSLPAPEVRRRARQAWGTDEKTKLLGCVGFLLPEKGQEHLIRALPAIRADVSTCKLLLAGEGPCRGRLERLARELGVNAAVHFTGFVQDVAQVYQALDLFLFPSLAEPLGSSLLAAMAHGLPVVAVGRGAVPEVVEDGRTGLLISAPDPTAIAAATLRLLRDAEQAQRLGRAAREAVQQRFTSDLMVENTLRVYKEALS